MANWLRSWLCHALFEDVIEEVLMNMDEADHDFLDSLGIPKSRIQPDGPCCDGLHARIRDEIERLKKEAQNG